MSEGRQTLDVLSLLLGASGVVMATLAILISFSIVCWYIIGYKYVYLRRAQRESSRFLDAFWQSRRLDDIYQAATELSRSPVSHVFRAGYIELGKLRAHESPEAAGGRVAFADIADLESIERALSRAQTSEVTRLESMVPFLATTGATAPFVGLFGTVWGIMNSFRNIGVHGQANLATVAPGIAEALIATAIGLVAAIPAVMAYNYFVRRIKVHASEMESFSKDFLNIVKRHFFK
jgi:biopolymer transport protein TolQ